MRDIAQAVELRKIKRDRQIVCDRLDGLDKQKAQLERDLEYVAGLRDAIDELEKIFRNALARFEAFDFDAQYRPLRRPGGARMNVDRLPAGRLRAQLASACRLSWPRRSTARRSSITRSAG